MAVPKYHEFFPSFLNSLADGKAHTIKEIRTYCAESFNLSEEDRQACLPSGHNILSDRVGWARTYLKKAGLILSPHRATFALTEEGKAAVRNGSGNVNLDYLLKFKSFAEFYNGPKKKSSCLINNEDTSKSPQEMISDALAELNSSLADDLMTEVMKLQPDEFEHLIIKLLVKMGYGSAQHGSATTTKKSGDEGIDGIVTSDKFGFDTIYTQAKRWKTDAVIGRSTVQSFAGALIGQGGSKGLFITTARFSKDAWNYAEKQLHCKIVLIDGKQLANLMIEHNLGVSTIATYEVKRVDSDFFNDAV